MNWKAPFFIIIYTVIIAGLIVGLIRFTKVGKWVGYNPQAATAEKFQAVFLTNGQVYFGHVKGAAKRYVTITDIYYLQVDQPIQPEPKDKTTEPKVSLIKLGGELHGPKDEMQINRDQILFIEELKDDSKVVQAISQYKTGNLTPAQQTPAETPSVTPKQ